MKIGLKILNISPMICQCWRRNFFLNKSFSIRDIYCGSFKHGMIQSTSWLEKSVACGAFKDTNCWFRW